MPKAKVTLSGEILPENEIWEEPYGPLYYFVPDGWDEGIYVKISDVVLMGEVPDAN